MEIFNMKSLTIPEGKVKRIIFPDGSQHRFNPIWESEYFTIESLEDGNELMFYGNTVGGSNDLYYSLNGGDTWNTTQQDDTNPFVTLNTGDKVMLKHNGAITTSNTNNSFIKCSKNHNIMGNIQSLFYFDNFYGETGFKDSCSLSYFFKGDTNLISAENLILPHLQVMYMGYMAMFRDCTNLLLPPRILATSVGHNFAFREMFYQCTQLTKVMDIPNLTDLGNWKSTFYSIYNKCTSLTQIPENYLSNLYNLGEHCFRGMFYGCTGLTNICKLPQTTLAEDCYREMFNYCSSLTTVPVNLLPATTLTTECYYYMFGNCPNLTQVPELPATTLADRCYQYMFYNSSKVNYIKMMATDISATDCLKDWVYKVSSTGIFVKNNAATWTTTGNSGIPTGWTVETAAA